MTELQRRGCRCFFCFFALQHDFQIYHIHILGVLLRGKHAFGVFLFCVLKGGLFLLQDMEKKGLMHASHITCHSKRTVRGCKYNENEESNARCLSPVFQIEIYLCPVWSISFNKTALHSSLLHTHDKHTSSVTSCRDMLKGTFFPCSLLLWISNYEKQIITRSLFFLQFYWVLSACLPWT